MGSQHISPALTDCKAATGAPLETAASHGAYSTFSTARRRLTLTIVTLIGFCGPLAAGIYLPSLNSLQTAFTTSATSINATVSVFLAVLAIAPLFWGFRADRLGRKTVYLASLLIYMAANTLLATLPTNLGALFVLRIVQGLGAASGISLGSGTVADITPPEKRACIMSIVLLGPQLGPKLGPLIGGVIVANASWRWTFGFLAIYCAVAMMTVILFLPETLRSIVGTGTIYADKPMVLPLQWRQRRVVDPKQYPSAPRLTLISLIRLLRLPPTFVVTLNNTFLYAAYYAINVEFTRLLRDTYQFSSTAIGCSYLAPGISLVAGSTISGRVSDFNVSRFMKRNLDQLPPPEYRLRLQLPGVLLSMSGVLMFGWFGHFHVHAASVIIASSVAALGMTWVSVLTTTYSYV